MRRLSLLFAVLIVVLLLGSDSSKEYDDQTESVGILGTWRLTEREVDGNKAVVYGEIVQTYRIGTYTIDGNGPAWQGRYRTDPGANPPRLDWYHSNGPFAGKTIKLIYQIDGDTLRIAFIADGDNSRRPQGFNDKGVSIGIYKRVK
jgi:uncharacterized protein (TIGR03067 family)